MFKSVYDALIEEGEEKNKKVTAENCLKKGLSIELTAEITGLTEEQVKEIAKRLGI